MMGCSVQLDVLKPTIEWNPKFLFMRTVKLKRVELLGYACSQPPVIWPLYANFLGAYVYNARSIVYSGGFHNRQSYIAIYGFIFLKDIHTTVS